jgi:hypothetical protein
MMARNYLGRNKVEDVVHIPDGEHPSPVGVV